jgi:hypothetical protein
MYPRQPPSPIEVKPVCRMCAALRAAFSVFSSALLELVLPDVGLVAVIGEMRMAVDQARHKGEPRDVDNPSVAAVFDPPARSRRVNLALLHDNAGIRDGLAARAVDQGPAD